MCSVQVPVYGHVECTGCHIMLMYPLGAQSVKCSMCHAVTVVGQQSAWQPAAGQAGSSQQQGHMPKTPTQTVVVENPPTLDEQGNEVRLERSRRRCSV